MTSPPQVPRHVGIIMDGNGRWARRRNRPVSFGHREGVRAIKPVMYACEDIGIEVLSVYAFSTENWSRPRMEVRALMRLFYEAFKREFDEIQRRGIRVLFSGRREGLSFQMRARMEEVESRTAANRNGIFNVCLNYGGRAELVDAVRRIVADGLRPAEVTEEAISARLYHPSLPEPDLVIRTAGERRTSNFMLWQASYAEHYVTETLWPDFNPAELKRAIADYQGRIRRFGARPELEVQAEAR